MKNILPALAIIMIAMLPGVGPAVAATPEGEAAFVAAYKKAFETGDEKTLKSFFYTEANAPSGMFTMMITRDMGKKISSIELAALTPAEIKDAETTKPMPNGKSTRLSLKPYKKLVIKIESRDEIGTTTTTSSTLVAEKDGRIVILLPLTIE